MKLHNLKSLTNDELRKILLTTDGMGKEAKEEALNELVSRYIRATEELISQ